MYKIIRKPMMVFSAAALAVSVSTAPVAAHDDFAKALAGVVAVGIIGAALADHQHNRGEEEYKRHPKVHADENAVGRCMHRTKKRVKKAGGYKAKLNHVRHVRANGDGKTKVDMVVTGYYSFGHKTSDVHCVVKNHKIVSFKHN
ncbi:MAG: hypothetical protein GY952_00050 [Rhodobacteraceae bacterium]|nr:hypothetical protein [Paracoccaceae bacterium]